MIRLTILMLAVFPSVSAMAQHAAHEPETDSSAEQMTDPHAEHQTGDSPRIDGKHHRTPPAHTAHGQKENAGIPPGEPPTAASSGPPHAADALFDPHLMAAARAKLQTEEGGLLHYLLLADRVEAAMGDGHERYAIDFQGWYGGDLHRLWFKAESEGELGDRAHATEIQALYSRAMSPFFDVQFGIRHDLRPDPDRSYLVAGLQGLLPFVFEVDAALFLSDEGDLSGRVETEYDLQVTRRLILQPRVEFDFAAQATPELGIGSGFSSLEAGVRLRYEIRRELAPYVGIAWETQLGDTADFARVAGKDRQSLQLVVGARLWF